MFRFRQKEDVLEIVKLDGLLLRHCSKEHRNDKDIVIAALLQDPYSIKYVKRTLYSDKEVMTTKCSKKTELALKVPNELNLCCLTFQISQKSFQYFPDEIKNDKKFVLEVIKEFPIAYKYLKDLKDDKDVIKEALLNESLFLRETPPLIYYVNKKFYSDKDIMEQRFQKYELKPRFHLSILALRFSPTVFKYLNFDIRNDRSFFLYMLIENPYIFQDLEEDNYLRLDREISTMAVSKNGNLLEYCHESFKNDPEFVLIAYKNNEGSLRFCSEELRNNVTFFKKMISLKYTNYQLGGPKVQSDREIVKYLAEIGSNLAIDVLHLFYDDEEIAYLTIKNDKHMINHFNPKFRKDKKMLMKLIESKNSGNIVSFFDKSLRDDQEVREKLISTFGYF